MQTVPNLTKLVVAAGILLAGLSLALQGHAASTAHAKPSSSIWINAYYPVWQEAYLPPDKIDYSAFSHITQFAVIPKADGSLDSIPARTITLADSQSLIPRAHAAGRKVIVSVGGANTLDVMRAAISDPIRQTFVDNLVQFVTARGYDGIDVDFEPLQVQDVPSYEKFVRALRARMNQVNPKLLLTAAVALQPATFARLQDCFDQINIMTYDLSGPWQGFSTWFNSAISNPSTQLMAGGVPYPTVQSSVAQFVQAGVAPHKIGIGLAFYGYLWSGATGPRQNIKGTTVTQPPYSEIMDKYYQPSLYRWDDQAHVPYLSIAAPESANSKFLSYDDEKSCAAKVIYARQAGLGGVIIWELGDGYRAGQPAGQKDRLLQSVKRAWKSRLTKSTAAQSLIAKKSSN